MRDIAERARQESSVRDAFDETHLKKLGLVQDPVQAHDILHANRINLEQWLTGTIVNPAQFPTYSPTEETIRSARENARDGQADLSNRAFRLGTALAWSQWMQMVFEATSDPEEIQAVLDYSHQSISAFVDSAAHTIQTEIARGLMEQAEGSPAKRRALIARLLNDEVVDPDLIARRLGYRLDQAHQAIIVWNTSHPVDPSALDRVIHTLEHLMGGAPLLSSVEDRRQRWIWLPHPLDRVQAERLCQPDLYLAIGPVLRGVDGFRDSHAAARIAQDMLADAPADIQIAFHDDVRLAALTGQDTERARSFVSEVLGALETAPLHIRKTLRVHLELGENVSRTARSLELHRNTIMRHLDQAHELLPRPISQNRIEIAVALDLMRWRA